MASSIGTYWNIPVALQDRLLRSSCTALWIGDSLSSQFYKGSQSSLFWGWLQRVQTQTIAGFHGTYSTGTGGAANHDLKMEIDERTNAGDNTHNGMGDPGVAQNDASAGAFAPLYMHRIGLVSGSSGSNEIYEMDVQDSPDTVNGSWWEGVDDMEAVHLIYQDANTPTGFDVRLIATRDSGNVSVSDINFAAETQSVGDGDGATFVANPADPSAGLSSLSFPLADDGTDEAAGDILYSVKQLDTVPASDYELTLSVPFYHAPSRTGLRLWNCAFGGWTTDDHIATTGTLGVDRHYTNTAIEQFLAHVDSHMPAMNTLVISLGTNDTITDEAAHLVKVKALIERWATRMDAHVSASDIMVLIVTPYRTSQTSGAIRDVDAWESIADTLMSEGTTTVPAAKFGVIKLSKAIGDATYSVFNEDWDEGDGTHLSPLGGQGFGELMNTAMVAPASTGGAAASSSYTRPARRRRLAS